MMGVEADEIYPVWDNGNLLCRTTVAPHDIVLDHSGIGDEADIGSRGQGACFNGQGLAALIPSGAETPPPLSWRVTGAVKVGLVTPSAQAEDILGPGFPKSENDIVVGMPDMLLYGLCKRHHTVDTAEGQRTEYGKADSLVWRRLMTSTDNGHRMPCFCQMHCQGLEIALCAASMGMPHVHQGNVHRPSPPIYGLPIQTAAYSPEI
jgi:hypothetical protein